MVALPLHSTKTPQILQVFQKEYVAYFGLPTHIVCAQNAAFSSSLREAFTEQLNIKMIMVSPTNHKSLLAEHGIKSLSTLLVSIWVKYGPGLAVCPVQFSVIIHIAFQTWIIWVHMNYFWTQGKYSTRLRDKGKCRVKWNSYRLIMRD